MAMYRQGLGSFVKEVGHDGIGIGGGFIAGGVVGRQVENLVLKTPVTESSPMSDKVLAWVANNGAKAALYALMKTYDAGSPMTKAATEALAGAAVYDTILRLANKGVNPADVSIGGYRILGGSGSNELTQRVIQENTLLRTELNKALQRMASMAGYRGPDSPDDFRYAGQVSPGVARRQTRFGQMPVTADVADRQKRFGAMDPVGLPFEQHPEKTSRQRKYGFAGAIEEMGFRPDAKDTSVAQLFNMQ